MVLWSNNITFNPFLMNKKRRRKPLLTIDLQIRFNDVSQEAEVDHLVLVPDPTL
jgi:hypothetical protein